MHRLEEARQVIRDNIGRHGLWASPTRYRYQCWTRDFVVTEMTALFDLGLQDVARSHLENLAARQREDGKIPILFTDDWLRLFLQKSWHSLRNHRVSFVLQRMLGPGIEKLSPWTKDPEIQFIIGIKEYLKHTGDNRFLERYRRQIDSALTYVETHVVRDGLVVGSDWRDMLKGLEGKALLTNNAFLYRVYSFLQQNDKAKQLEDRINKEF